MMIRNYFFFFALAFLVIGCSAAGFRPLGDCVSMPDKSQMCANYGKTPGHSGPDVTWSESIQCDPKCQVVSRYYGTAPGAVETGIATVGTATVSATGQMVSAHFLSQTKPTRVNSPLTVNNGNDLDNSNATGVEVHQEQSQKGGNAVAKGGGPVNVTANGGQVVGSGNSSASAASTSKSKGGSTGPIVTHGGEGGKVVGSGNSSNAVDLKSVNVNKTRTGEVNNGNSINTPVSTSVNLAAELNNSQKQQIRPNAFNQDP